MTRWFGTFLVALWAVGLMGCQSEGPQVGPVFRGFFPLSPVPENTSIIFFFSDIQPDVSDLSIQVNGITGKVKRLSTPPGTNLRNLSAVKWTPAQKLPRGDAILRLKGEGVNEFPIGGPPETAISIAEADLTAPELIEASATKRDMITYFGYRLRLRFSEPIDWVSLKFDAEATLSDGKTSFPNVGTTTFPLTGTPYILPEQLATPIVDVDSTVTNTEWVVVRVKNVVDLAGNVAETVAVRVNFADGFVEQIASKP